MAVTHIHAVTGTVNLSLDYIMSDKKECTLKDDVADSIKYIMDDKTGEVTYFTLTSTLNCSNPQNPYADFYELMEKYGRDEIINGNPNTKDGKPILAWHLVQSFEQEFDKNVDPCTANEIGRKLAEELFGDYPVVISTHTNTENIHNHIEFCAWNLDGGKWHQCNENYQKIRECSDRLCDEYGLSVLEQTRRQKLIKWEDGEGNTRYFEPTDRKIEMARKREAGELSPDDVNSYRNTIPYEVAEAKKATNVETVKRAIDSALPYATSYDHLLDMLREMGFEVKAKKKNGQWRSHVTFTPPAADKGVRDYSIDKETGYYTRENLTAVIEQQTAERRRNEEMQASRHIPYYEEYEYGEVDVQAIDEDYRAGRTPDGGVKIVQRGQAERSIIRDVKQSDMELCGLYDLTTLRNMIAQQKEARKHKVPAQKREEVLIRRIQDNFESLRFVERKQLYSYNQINEIVKGLWQQYNACLEKINEADGMITRLENVVQAPAVLEKIKERMEQGKGNPEYMVEQYHSDAKLMHSCMEAIKKYNITDSESRDSLQATIQKYREQTAKLQAALGVFSKELAAYDRCVTTLARIDRDSGRDNGALVTEYQNIVKRGQQQAEQTREKKKQKGHER